MFTTKDWMKDVLLFGCVLGGIAAIGAFLLATERVKPPATFHNTPTPLAQLRGSADRLDAVIDQTLLQSSLSVAQQASSHRVFRRLSLALTGCLPSIEELREVEKFAQKEQVHWYVSHLLEDQRSADFLSERFARIFVGIEEGPFLVYRRRRFKTWLAGQIHKNVPYDQMCRTMLTSNGIWTDKPEVNFYTYNIIPDVEDEAKPDPVRLAGRTSRAFLGMRIDCLQCHDDFLGTMNLGSTDEPVEGTQRHFHSLASFFSQVENSVTGIYDNLESSEYQYQLLDDTAESLIAADVPFAKELDNTAETNLRLRLANWVTHNQNRMFARSIVNRIWAIMFGRGFFQPVDDIPLEGPFPEALETLVDEFIDNGYNLHRLIRVIAHSKTFARESSAEFEILPNHQNHFAVYPMTRLRPEQVAGAIIQSTSLKTIDSTSHIISRLTKFGQQADFIDRFGDLGEDEFNEKGETITQRLLMMNGEMVRERLDNGINSVQRVAGLSPNLKTAVEIVFLATLSREPTDAESDFFVAQLSELNRSERPQKISDIYWSLINSVEFVWNH